MYGSTAGGYLTLEYNSDYHPYIAIKIDMKLYLADYICT